MKTTFSFRFKLSLGAMLFSLMAVFAQNHERQIYFLETFGLPSAEYNALSTYVGWRETSAQYIGQNVEVRNTQHSCQLPTYLKGSGDGNIFFSGMDLNTGTIPTESQLIIKNINTANYSDLQLQFAYRKHNADILPILNLSYSSNSGSTWNSINYVFAEQADAVIGWYLSPVISLPTQAISSNLWLKFTKPESNSATNTRIDDVKITGNHFHAPPVVAAATNVTSSSFTANWQAVPNAQKYILEVSDNANFATSTNVTLAGWTFPGEYVDATAPSTLANIGTAANIGIASISKTSTGDFYSATGPGGSIGSSIAINSSGWHDGMFSKYYQIKINASGYRNLKLSSKSLSSANGPRYLTVQYKLGNSDLWLNVPNSDIDNYPDVTWNTAAMLNDLTLPSACNNQSELYIRWVVAGGVRADDTKQNYAVTSGGASRMTDIIVKGQQALTLNGYSSKEITSTSETISGLTGTDYYYRVKAVDNTDSYYSTNFSNTVHVTLAPVVQVTTDKNSSTLGLTALSDVAVAAGTTLTLDVNTSINKLSLAPTAKLSLGNKTISATAGVVLQSSSEGTATILGDNAVSNATVEQYVTSGRNWYISSPVSSASYNALSKGNSVVEWNEITKNWGTKSSGTLTRGKGYIQVAEAAQGTTGTLSFEGTTNAGTIDVPVTRTESGNGPGFNLIGNPYPSYLDWSDIIANPSNANISSTFWYRTLNTTGAYTFVTYNGAGGTYVTSNGTANTTITGKIPPMQAFWVRVNSGIPSTIVQFANNMREHRDDNQNIFKAPKVDERASLRLQLLKGEKSDETMVYFDENASNTFDTYDSPKMMNNSDIEPDLYTKAGSERLVINGLKDLTDNMELPLGFNLNTASTLKLKASELVNFDSGTRIYLLDKEDKTQTELFPETEYSFSTTSSTTNNEDRFSLLFRTPGISTGVDNADETTLNVFIDANNQIIVAAPLNSNYTIYNAIGQQIQNGTLNYKLQTLNCKLNTGIYIVKVLSNGKELTSRIIIK